MKKMDGLDGWMRGLDEVDRVARRVSNIYILTYTLISIAT